MTKIGTKITRAGQVTIPKKIREKYGFKCGMFILFETDKKGVYIVPAELTEVE